MRRRAVLKAAIPLGLAALTGQPARAATPEIRFARQFSMGYLQFNVMEHQGLVEKHAKALGLDEIKVSWVTLNGPEAMNGALLSDSVDVVSGGIPGLVTFWARTRGTAQEVKAISALSSQPCLLNTRNAALRSIADLGPQDRIALPTVKVSIQAVTLEMAAAKLLGPADSAKFDPLTVSMGPPDATVALLSGAAGIDCAFSVPPFQEQQLQQAGIHTLLNSFDVAGSHSFTLCWTSSRFAVNSASCSRRNRRKRTSRLGRAEGSRPGCGGRTPALTVARRASAPGTSRSRTRRPAVEDGTPSPTQVQ
ncbi:MAG: ABC transporter substrate-binding protein [Janthinobacterium lividum]